MADRFILRVFRGSPGKQYWEEFDLPYHEHSNIISALMEIRRKPVNRKGEDVAPVVWEDGCLEEVCGSCSMLINGKPRQACTALIKDLLNKKNTVSLAPFTKFPLVRDLIVDRSRMFENLKKVHAWIDADSSHDRGPGAKISSQKQEIMYTLSTCMVCGCCSESCPQVNDRSKFMGPAPISQVRLFNAHPVGAMQKSTRIHALMGEGGVSDCGNAQNCVRVCPKKIPLTDGIAAAGRDVTMQALKDLFSLPDRE